jgi:hypothetical protein
MIKYTFTRARVHLTNLDNSDRIIALIDVKSRLIADWSVENMNHDMTSNEMLLDPSEIAKIFFFTRYNKHLILIRL